jgi:hypothetical protein
LSITNGGVVDSIPNSFDLAGWVGRSGTMTGNNTFLAGGPSTAPTVLAVNGTLAPSKSLRIDATLNLLSPSTTVCNLTALDLNIVNLAVSRKAVLGGHLQVTMNGSGFTPGMRFTLLHAGEGLNFQGMFGSVSINYPVCPTCMPMFTPVIQYDYDGGNVYLYLDPDVPEDP